MGAEKTDSEPEESRCNVCREPINTGAIKCNACGCYQSKLRRLFVELNVQALVALIPVATLALVFIKDLFITPVAELHTVPLSCKGDNLKIAVANIGTRSALLTNLSLIDDGNKIPLTLSESSQVSRLVEAGDIKVIALNALDASGHSLGLDLSVTEPCQYELQLRSAMFQQQTAGSLSICACPTE